VPNATVRSHGATSATTNATATQTQPGRTHARSAAMAISDRPTMWWRSTVVRSHHGVNGSICCCVTMPVDSPIDAGIVPRSRFST
jgi:hypothetical protein